MKTIVIDGQMFQTNAWHRGMGMYAKSLFAQVLVQKNAPKVDIVLNKNMPTGDRVREIQTVFPDSRLHYLDLPVDPKPGGGDDRKAREALDVFIDDNFGNPKEVTYFIPSLFLFDYAAVFPSSVKKTLLFHDLTPLIYREELEMYFPSHLYFTRFTTIFEADVVFANSQTTANDLTKYLGVSPKRLKVIDGSLSSAFLQQNMQEGEGIFKRLDIKKGNYVLLPTGTTAHKNNIRAAQAFMKIKRASPGDLKLVTTSFYRDFEIEDLRSIAGDNIIFTGNASDAEMSALFKHSSVVMFPSLYEGLGLPVLEGIVYDKPVVCSDAAVFQEIPHFTEALYVCDRFNVDSISDALLSALAAVNFETKKAFYPTILKKYNWESSAELFTQTINDDNYFATRPKPTKTIAVICPDPRRNKDVARFAQRMAGYALAAGVELHYFLDSAGVDVPGELLLPDYVRAIATSYDLAQIYSRAKDYDAILSLPSADQRFYKLFRAALTLPGIVYVGHENYNENIESMAKNGVISDDQHAVEKNLAQFARESNLFENISLLAQAKGIIVERPYADLIKRTIKHLKLNMAVLEVAPTNEVNVGKNVLESQAKTYEAVIDFVKRQVK